MSTVDVTRNLNFSCICDLVEYYRKAYMLLAILTKRFGYGKIRTIVLSASFSCTSGLKRKCLLNASFIFDSLVYTSHRSG